jgi:hypothetical protein
MHHSTNVNIGSSGRAHGAQSIQQLDELLPHRWAATRL